MPIRMEKDDPQNPNQGGGGSGSNRGGGRNPLLALLPLLIGFFLKNPKMTIMLLLVGGALYYFSGGSLFQGIVADQPADDDSFTFGCSLDEEVYDRAEVFEPLAYSSTKNRLPASVSLLEYAPRRENQGRQGSCVGWASSYAARTILHAKSTGSNPDQVRFSPSFLYNQIALPNCQGSYMMDAMESMKKSGVLPLTQFEYDEASCSRKPNSSQKNAASQYRTRGYNRLTKGGNNYKVDMMGIKQNIAQGAPVVIGMQVGGTFMRNMYGKQVWNPTRTDKQLYGFSGHAMCVTGYDDNKAGGSFEIMNSWGPQWGENGVCWVRYPDFEFFVKEAYGLYPMGDASTKNILQAKFGLVFNESLQNIPFKQVNKNTFRTVRPIAVGDKFKVEVTNSVECYTYVFGEETDGSSYVLFPYTRKHSPYCGITGTRLFPKDYSMKADDLGNRDRIAVVVTKEPIDYNALNEAINNSPGSSYADKLNNALSRSMVERIAFRAGDLVEFAADTEGKNAVGIVLEIDKQ